MEHGDEEAQLLFEGRRAAAFQPSASRLAKKDRVEKFKTRGVTKRCFPSAQEAPSPLALRSPPGRTVNFGPCVWFSTFSQNPLAGYWELGFAHTFGSPVR